MQENLKNKNKRANIVKKSLSKGRGEQLGEINQKLKTTVEKHMIFKVVLKRALGGVLK